MNGVNRITAYRDYSGNFRISFHYVAINSRLNGIHQLPIFNLESKDHWILIRNQCDYYDFKLNSMGKQRARDLISIQISINDW